jgi:hypothetical protein
VRKLWESLDLLLLQQLLINRAAADFKPCISALLPFVSILVFLSIRNATPRCKLSYFVGLKNGGRERENYIYIYIYIYNPFYEYLILTFLSKKNWIPVLSSPIT